MLDYQTDLKWDIPGVNVQASVGQQWTTGLALLQQAKSANQLGAVVIVGLGTNGPITTAQFDSMMSVLSGASRVVFVNVFVDRAWQDPNNAVLATGVHRYPNAVIADWYTLASQNPSWLYSTGTHLPIGGHRSPGVGRHGGGRRLTRPVASAWWTRGSSSAWSRSEGPGDDGSHWRLTVGPELSTPGKFLFGGCGLGAGLVALEAASGRPTVWATAQYLSYATTGSIVDYEVTLAVVGGHVTQGRAVARTEGREILTVNAALGEPQHVAHDVWVEPPSVPGPEECPKRGGCRSRPPTASSTGSTSGWPRAA